MTSKNAKFQKKEEEDVVDDEGCLEQHEQEQEEGDEKRTKSKRCEQCAKSENVITASQYRARKNNPLLFSGVVCVSVCVCVRVLTGIIRERILSAILQNFDEDKFFPKISRGHRRSNSRDVATTTLLAFSSFDERRVRANGVNRLRTRPFDCE